MDLATGIAIGSAMNNNSTSGSVNITALGLIFMVLMVLYIIQLICTIFMLLIEEYEEYKTFFKNLIPGYPLYEKFKKLK